ncbi:MAG: VOC family protein [Nitrososphaerota archaeon]|jgi:predicted enzyme related to lactoylglutathione lyase|nr:VOC family protein [Nitrososphaeraceae archaeon]
MFKRLGAAILLVEDLEKSVNFYRDILELKIKNQSPDWVEFQNEAQGAVLALHPARIKQKGFSNMLVGFNVNNLESVCKKLEGKGVKFHKRITEESFGKHAIIEDPEGHLISVVEIPPKEELGQIPYYHGFAPVEGLM